MSKKPFTPQLVLEQFPARPAEADWWATPAQKSRIWAAYEAALAAAGKPTSQNMMIGSLDKHFKEPFMWETMSYLTAEYLIAAIVRTEAYARKRARLMKYDPEHGTE